MDFRDAISARLPEPRDDEPPSLRQDIVDEIGDHLASAYKRELLRGVGASAAREAVLERFGDPARVALRLWLDEMKGKIMTQRILIATCLVVMAACITAVGLSWHWMNHDQLLRSRAAAEAVEANRRMSEALAQSQAVNEEMLKQMREMSQSVLHPVSADWNPVIFKLTEETADGPPAAGLSLTLTELHGMPAMGGGGGAGSAATRNIYRTSDTSGTVDFGAVQPGDYRFMISKSWDSGYFQTQGELNVGPGSKVERSIICPKTPPEKATVRVHCSWPADLAKEQLVLRVPFAFRDRRLEPGLDWSLTDTVAQERPKRRRNLGAAAFQGTGFWSPVSGMVRTVLCGPGPQVSEVARLRMLYLWRYANPDAPDAQEQPVPDNGGNPTRKTGRGAGMQRMMGGPGGRQTTETTPLGPGDWADVAADDLHEIRTAAESPQPRELQFELGTYGVDSLVVLRPAHAQPVEPGRKRFNILAASFANGDPLHIEARRGPPDKQDLKQRVGGMMGGMGTGMGGMWTGMGGGMGGMRRVGVSEQWLNAATIELPTEYWDQFDTSFEVQRGRVNEWTIRLPDELIKAVRAALNEEAKIPEPKPAAPNDEN